MFDKNSKRGLKYWFAHWCAYQMTALNLNVWKFKYLFHDIEKPFLELILPHDKVKKWHKIHSKHHLSYRNKNKIDYEALVIDWECSHLTKSFRPEKARDVFYSRVNTLNTDQYYKILHILDNLKI